MTRSLKEMRGNIVYPILELDNIKTKKVKE